MAFNAPSKGSFAACLTLFSRTNVEFVSNLFTKFPEFQFAALALSLPNP
jgi:hypothetical protein